MKFKLDENLGASTQKIIRDKGYDCLTFVDEGLSGASDPQVLGAANSEGRILVTMDHHFGNVFVYPPEKSPGIALINPPGRSSMTLLHTLILTLIEALQSSDIAGRLWIVEPGRIREHEPSESFGMEDK
jgi:predicted nuclease of predicted toxin-antitoxin system